MISIIVPVYNVEQFLPKCLDSIRNQSYGNLEILLIDDASTDRSGRICDEYAEKDRRIRVFHTKNRGLSAARNLGLDEAKGEWIGFVDSDDWIEADMYECLLKRAEEAGADIVECGIYSEYANNTVEEKREIFKVTGTEAVRLLLDSKLCNMVWNKLYKRDSFISIRFPADRIYEDIATTYRVFAGAARVCSIEACKYHYVKRSGSLSRTKTMKNLTDYWLSHKERYDFLKGRQWEDAEIQLRFCARAAARTWALYCDCSTEDRKALGSVVTEMNSFVRQNISLLGLKKWGMAMRIGVFFPHFMNSFSFRLAWLAFKTVKKRLLLDYRLEQTIQENTIWKSDITK